MERASAVPLLVKAPDLPLGTVSLLSGVEVRWADVTGVGGYRATAIGRGALSQCCQQCGHLLQCQGPEHSGENLPQETCDHVLLALGPIGPLPLELTIL